jgi:REP element-mobilizing transposase RayT
VAARFPHHVTMRVRADVKSLRRGRVARIVRNAIRAGGHKPDFRVIEFNVLSNQVHLIIEASHAMRLARGMQGLAVRFARRINRAFARRGKFFADRYHARALRTPRETRNAIRHVLNNERHHAAARGERIYASWVDAFSSAPWFTGWARPIRNNEPWMRELRAQPPPTAQPTVWLLTHGWRRHGLLRFDELGGDAQVRR